MKQIIILALLLIPIIQPLRGQSKSEIRFQLPDTAASASNTYAFSFDSDNEVKFSFHFMYVFYKKFVSSQDASQCGFYPSCSTYALQAIQKQGVIVGIINFFDRYSRCNGFSPSQYGADDKHPELMADPVRDATFCLPVADE